MSSPGRPQRWVDEGIFGGARLSATALLGVGALRQRGDRPFSDEDMALFEGYAHGARGLWCARDRAAELGARLPPRLRRLLGLMLSGASEKQIAADLALSRHTVTPTPSSSIAPSASAAAPSSWPAPCPADLPVRGHYGAPPAGAC